MGEISSGPVERERPAVEGEGAVCGAAQSTDPLRLLERPSHLVRARDRVRVRDRARVRVRMRVRVRLRERSSRLLVLALEAQSGERPREAGQVARDVAQGGERSPRAEHVQRGLRYRGDMGEI